MAASTELSADETLFQDFFTEPDMSTNNLKKKDLNETKAENKKGRKSKNVMFDENLEDKRVNSQKRGSILKISNKKKSLSLIKPARQPLKALFLTPEARKEHEVLETKESAENVSEQKNLPSKEEKKDENVGPSRVIVYEDKKELESGAAEVQTENSQPPEPLASAKGPKVSKKRRSLASERGKSLEAVAPAKPGKNRYTLNDLLDLKPLSETTKVAKSHLPLGAVEKKSPTQSRVSANFAPHELEEITRKLEALFPDVDPDYLRSQCVKFKGSILDATDVISVKKGKGELPSRADYLKRQETERLQDRYKENFSVENFLKIIPHPREYFLSLERGISVRYAVHSFHYLKNKFKKHYTRTIQYVLAKNEYSLYLSDKELKKKSGKMRITNRRKVECDTGKPLTFDVQFMQEVVFIENESKIKSYIRRSEAAKSRRFQQAQEAGALLECQSCCDYNLLLEDVLTCSADHVFCKECVVRYADIEIEAKSFSFKCLTKCDNKFFNETLQETLGPAVVAYIIGGLQSQEFKPEGIENLVCCPFCYHTVWMSSELNVLICPNPGCEMESCRYCKQPNHMPQKCSELENMELGQIKLEDNVMKTLPISRTCPRCKMELSRGKRQNSGICCACRGLLAGGDAGDSSSSDADFVEGTEQEKNVGDEVLGGGRLSQPQSGPTTTTPDFFSTDSISF